ncbi:MAG: NAD(P) transhydrogenase subunit alpha part 2 [Alphaproteobacteria bacterium]|nr:NAD(P) transhydrogenase subunit alpha part 2 [Alphaproteobacteria bacterium]
MDPAKFADDIGLLAAEQERLGKFARLLADNAQGLAAQAGGGHHDFFVIGLTVFVLACFVGYYVVWKVTPALHSPLMAVTNAVSSVIIVGALIAAGSGSFTASGWIGLVAVALASVNIFGGFIVTQRMLQMFKKKEKPADKS